MSHAQRNIVELLASILADLKYIIIFISLLFNEIQHFKVG